MPDANGAPGAPPAERRDHTLHMQRRAVMQPETFNAEQRTVELIFTTGADVQRFDWWEGKHYVERLLVTAEAVDLSRLNAGAPLLNTHSAWDLGDIIGVVERAWIDGGEGRAIVRFSEREDVAPIMRDVQAGIIRNVSSGYWVQEWRITRPEDGGKEIREAVRWMPGEISLVPVPADAGAQIRSAPDMQRGDAAPAAIPTTPPASPAISEEVRMPDANTPSGGQPATTTTTDDAAAAARREAQEAETARVRGIHAAQRALARPDAEADALVREGATLEAAQSRMIEAAAKARAAGGTTHPAAVNVLSDEGDTARRALSDALLHRCGLLRDDKGAPQALPEASRQYRGMRMIGFAAEAIRIRGGDTRGMLPVEIARAALVGDREMMARAGLGFHSTSDFPNLLANTASKALGAGYSSARRTFTVWARQRTLPDFKQFRVINLGGAPQLLQISPTGADAGEIQFGTIGEGAETYQLFRAGRRIAVTFEALVNDDMDGFSRVPEMFGAAAGRLESDTVYSIFNSNPNMSDGNALFGTAHVNIFGNGVAGFAAGDGVLDVTGLGVGRRVMRTQTAPNGDILDVEPTYLLVPAALEARALQYTSMAFVPAAAGSINPFASALTPVVEPRLVSAVQWYLIASSNQVDTVEYAYLEGMEAPQITTYTDEDTDGVIVKCTHSFGAKATDSRGMARASGT